MSKLSKLFVIGTGIAVANYYTKNPNKIEEHAEFVKKKSKDYYGYTKCMISYTKKNGIEDAAKYMYNDFKNVVNKTKDNLEKRYNNAVEYGKELSENVSQIKEQACDVKEYSKGLKENIAIAKEISEKTQPALDSYKKHMQTTLNSIKDQVENIKQTVVDSQTQKKLEAFKKNAIETLENVKEQVQTDVLHNNNNK
ncbi:hypothetical protein [Gemella bergeri]